MEYYRLVLPPWKAKGERNSWVQMSVRRWHFKTDNCVAYPAESLALLWFCTWAGDPFFMAVYASACELEGWNACAGLVLNVRVLPLD